MIVEKWEKWLHKKLKWRIRSDIWGCNFTSINNTTHNEERMTLTKSTRRSTSSCSRRNKKKRNKNRWKAAKSVALYFLGKESLFLARHSIHPRNIWTLWHCCHLLQSEKKKKEPLEMNGLLPCSTAEFKLQESGKIKIIIYWEMGKGQNGTLWPLYLVCWRGA